jgi:hypothetical protein
MGTAVENGPFKIRTWQLILAGVLLLLVLAGVDLGMQELYHRYLQPAPAPSPVPTLHPTSIPTPRPTPLPTLAPTPSSTISATLPLTFTPTPVPVSFDDPRIQEALQRTYFREQMLKASVELLRAETYLDSNDMKQVERELIAVSATLEQAGRFADESFQETIANLQQDLSRLREDLYLRPERLREGMRQLWQLVDALIGE